MQDWPVGSLDWWRQHTCQMRRWFVLASPSQWATEMDNGASTLEAIHKSLWCSRPLAKSSVEAINTQLLTLTLLLRKQNARVSLLPLHNHPVTFHGGVVFLVLLLTVAPILVWRRACSEDHSVTFFGVPSRWEATCLRGMIALGICSTTPKSMQESCEPLQPGLSLVLLPTEATETALCTNNSYSVIITCVITHYAPPI